MSNPIEIPFSTTLLVRDNCLCLHVQRAARALARRFDVALRPLGLTNGQFSLMMSLNRPNPPGMKPVADLLAMDQTTLTAALKPLERRGWVAISRNPDDKRGRLLSLTEAGKAILVPAIGARSRIFVGKILPGIAAGAVILAYRAPGPLTDIRSEHFPIAGHVRR